MSRILLNMSRTGEEEIMSDILKDIEMKLMYSNKDRDQINVLDELLRLVTEVQKMEKNLADHEQQIGRLRQELDGLDKRVTDLDGQLENDMGRVER